MTTTEILKEGESRMQGVIAATKKSFAVIRTGRANPALLDRIVVSYYGTPTPLTQMAGISAPEPRLLVISPWDKNSIKDIERAILASDSGLTPPMMDLLSAWPFHPLQKNAGENW